MGISLRPSTFSESFSAIDDVDVVISRARFTEFDYQGKSAPQIGLIVYFTDDEGAEHNQFYSAGQTAAAMFTPSESPDPEKRGLSLDPIAENAKFAGGSNAGLFLKSLVNAGFDENSINDDISAIEGVKVHVNLVPDGRKGGLPMRPGQQESRNRGMILLVTRIIEAGAEGVAKGAVAKKSAAPAAAKKTTATATTTSTSAAKTKANGAAPAPAAASALDPELIEQLQSYALQCFVTLGESSMPKVKFIQKMFATIPNNPEELDASTRLKLLSLCSKDEALHALEGFAFDGSVVSLA